ncbi:hypothetical protein ACGLHS_07480 [Variovorax sp. VaC1]|uniref:hypothetical protein n=1 Tax=Variovorax sp. VaC1 TaxID=3373132 RepID=UPI003748C43B
MNQKNCDDRISIKDALPRLYASVAQTLRRDRPELLEQLESLYLVDRCKCGMDGCVSFTCESADARFAPINSRRPLSYPLDDIHGWYSVSEDGVLAGFEILDDYEDEYVSSRLADSGLGFNFRSSATKVEKRHENLDKNGSARTFEAESATETEKQSTNSVYMTAGSTQHLIDYRLKVQGYEPKEIAEFAEAAMASTARPEATIIRGAQYPSLVSVAVRDLVTQRVCEVRMPLNKVGGGFEARSLVPEDPLARGVRNGRALTP